MGRLLDEDDVIDAVSRGCQEFRGIFARCEKNLNELPPAQPEREKGKWTKDCACEICGFKPWYERDIHTLSFCPNCGADMRGEQDD